MLDADQDDKLSHADLGACCKRLLSLGATLVRSDLEMTWEALAPRLLGIPLELAFEALGRDEVRCEDVPEALAVLEARVLAHGQQLIAHFEQLVRGS